MKIQISNYFYEIKDVYAKVYDSRLYRYENVKVNAQILSDYNTVYFFFIESDLESIRQKLEKFKSFRLYIGKDIYDLEYRHALHINHPNKSLGFCVSLNKTLTKKDLLVELIMSN
jgi:hypothetical protein